MIELKILIKDLDIVTMGPKGIIKGGAIAIENDKIVDVGDTKKISKGFRPDVELGGKMKVAIPGLISCHQHSINLTRGAGPIFSSVSPPPANFVEWLEKLFWPHEDKRTKKDIYYGNRNTYLEHVLAGITCCFEVVEGIYTPLGVLDEVENAANELGVRVVAAFEARDEGGVTPEQMELGYRENLNFVKKTTGKDVLVKGAMAVHAPFSCPDELLMKTKEAAVKYKTLSEIHLGQDKVENEISIKKRGIDDVERLNRIGFLGPETVGGHCVWFSKKGIETYAKSGAAVSHNTISNMMGGLGRAQIPTFLKLETRVGLGIDHSWFDMFEVMRATAMLHNIFELKGDVIGLDKILAMATIDGAKVLGLERQIGSIEPSKKADIVILDFNKPHLTPYRAETAIGHVVTNCHTSDVDTTIVNGKILMQNRTVKIVDEQKILQETREAALDFWRRLGVKGV